MKINCLVTVLLTTFLLNIGAGQNDIFDTEIKLCRMRNCTIVEDLRSISEARTFGTFVHSFSNGNGFAFNSVYSHARAQIRTQPYAWSFGYVSANGFVRSPNNPPNPHSPPITTIFTNDNSTKKQEQNVYSIFPTKQEENVQSIFPTDSGSPSSPPPPKAFPPPPPTPSPPSPPGVPSEFKKTSQGSNNFDLNEDECYASIVARVGATRQLSILSEALTETGLDSVLEDFQGTLLAPTNDAWERLSEGSGQSLDNILQDVDMLRSILGLHILPGEPLLLSDFQNGDILITIVEGETLSVEVTGDNVRLLPSQQIAAADILVPDVPACGAVIHVLDGVLLANVASGRRKLAQIAMDQNLMSEKICKYEEYEPCCEEYKVQDTDFGICDIATRFGIECEDLQKFNDVENVQAGDLLQVC